MATSAGRAKRDREKARQERQALKRERRQSGREQSPADEDGDADAAEPTVVPQEELLERLAELHQRFGDGEIGFDEFETTKEALLRDLQI